MLEAVIDGLVQDRRELAGRQHFQHFLEDLHRPRNVLVCHTGQLSGPSSSNGLSGASLNVCPQNRPTSETCLSNSRFAGTCPTNISILLPAQCTSYPKNTDFFDSAARETDDHKPGIPVDALERGDEQPHRIIHDIDTLAACDAQDLLLLPIASALCSQSEGDRELPYLPAILAVVDGLVRAGLLLAYPPLLLSAGRGDYLAAERCPPCQLTARIEENEEEHHLPLAI